MKKVLIVLLTLLSGVAYGRMATCQHVKTDTSADAKRRIRDTTFVLQNSGSTRYPRLNGKIFEENAYFSNNNLPASPNFSTAYFKKDAVFSTVTFTDFVDFSAGTFLKDLNLSSCRFHKFLFMSGIATDSITDIYFYNASLPELIDFSHNILLYRTVDFTNANFDSLGKEKTFWKDRRHYINIYNTDITKIKIGYTHFKMCFYDPQKKDKILTSYLCRLIQSVTKDTIVNCETFKIWDANAVYNKLIASGIYKDYVAETFPSAKMGDTVITNLTRFYIRQQRFPARLYDDQIDALYSRLLKNFETNGQMDSYKLLDIDYQDYRWSNKIAIISWLHIFPKYWNFYGHDRDFIFGWTAFFLIVFSLINYVFYVRLFSKTNKGDVVYDIENLPRLSEHSKHPRLNRWKCAFIYTSLIFFTLSIKTEKLNFKRPAFFYVVIINISGLLCLAYLANFILQK